MRRIRRFKLTESAATTLRTLQTKVDQTPRERRGDAAAKLWGARTKAKLAAFGEVRAKLQRMCSGLERCMYCEDSLGTDIDHFRPKAEYPRRAFRWRNYFLACSHCNSNEKRSEFPMDGKARLLLKPTVDNPFLHLHFVPATGHFGWLTREGEETARVLGLNTRRALFHGRRNAWVTLVSHLRNYAKAGADERGRIQTAVREMQFRAVVQYFFADALDRRESVPSDICDAVAATRSDWEWVNA